MYCTKCGNKTTDGSDICEACRLSDSSEQCVRSIDENFTSPSQAIVKKDPKKSVKPLKSEGISKWDSYDVKALKEISIIYSALEKILIMLFVLSLLFIPMFKTVHKYTPASLEELADLNSREVELLLENGYVEVERFSLMDEFSRMCGIIKPRKDIVVMEGAGTAVQDISSHLIFYYEATNPVTEERYNEIIQAFDGLTFENRNTQDHRIAIATGIINTFTVLFAALTLCICIYELFKIRKEHIEIKRGGAIKAPTSIAAKKITRKMPIILLCLTFADIIYAALIWGNFANSLASNFKRYMMYLSGFTYGLIITLFLSVAIAFIRFLNKELDDAIANKLK